MADNKYESLSGEVDIDGEGSSRSYLESFHSSEPMIERGTSKDMEYKGFRPHDFEPRADSGISSLCSTTASLTSNPSLSQDSLPSSRAPVQCSEAHADTQSTAFIPGKNSDTGISNLTDSVSKIAIVEEDEGIDSLIVPSVVSSNLNEPELDNAGHIEIDLYEQDSDGDTLIHIAILNKQPDVASLFIDLAETAECLDIQNELFQTPMHVAILTQEYEIARRLVAKGANVTLRDQQGNTPLHIACRQGDIEAVKIITESFGKDSAKRRKMFDIKNCEGITCLHIASENKHFDIMGYLFAKGADVNVGDTKSGRTILHNAVEKHHLDTVVLLLTHSDIDVEAKTYKGETPIVLAFWRNYQDIVKKLKSKGAYFGYELFEESDDENA